MARTRLQFTVVRDVPMNGASGAAAFGWLAACCLELLALSTCCATDTTVISDRERLLTSVQRIRQLSLEEAARAIPVRLRGVVTYYDASRRFGFIQDGTGGIHFVGQHFVEGSAGFDWPPLSAGDLIDLKAITARGNFSPYVAIEAGSHDALHDLETSTLPAPICPPIQHLLNPGNHNQWCEVPAILTGAKREGERTILELNSGGLQYQGILPFSPTDERILEQWLFSEVSIRAVYGALFDNRRQMIGLELFIPFLKSIKPIETGTGQLFEQSPTSIEELLRFRDPSPERVLLKGVVLSHLPGKGLYLRSEKRGLWVETDIRASLQPGDSVRVVGRPMPGELRPYLADSIVQVESKGEPPEPRHLQSEQALSAKVDGDLIRVTARLLDRIDLPNVHVMLLRGDKTTFSARCPESTQDIRWPAPAIGSWLELTGVCTVQAAGTWHPADPERPNLLTRTPASLTLLLRDPSDLVVLHEPSWWTLERVALLAVAIALVATLAFVWAGLLRRRLHQQTQLMTETIARESTQQERARIARDLHDTLQQNLTGIMHQLNSTSNRLSGMSERAAESLNLAKRMIQHSLEDVRYTIWNLRSASLGQADVNGALREMLESFLQQEDPIIHFWPSPLSRSLSSVAQHHLVNIAKEALHNAIQHAQAHRVDIRLDIETRQLTVTVADDGIGFETRAIDASKGHFGLMGMSERAAKIHGDLQVRSGANQGTSVSVTVPLPHDASQGDADE